MIYIIKELPEHVRLSEHLRDQAKFYLCVQSLGISYYIPATPEICCLMELDADGADKPRDRRRAWSRFEKADALRAVVSAIELQVRDVVLAGIEQDVKDALLRRMEEVMTPTVRGMIEQRAQSMLPPPGDTA